MTEVTFPAVAARLRALLPGRADDLTPDTVLSDLAVDSVDLVEAVIDLQEGFGVGVTHAQLYAVRTVGDLVELLRGRTRVAQN